MGIVFWISDGSTQQLSGCLRDFRNKPFATRAKIEYYMNTLTVCNHSFFNKLLIIAFILLNKCICLINNNIVEIL